MTDPKEKPKTASLLSTMSPESVTLEDAKRLLSLPRVVGQHPDGGEILSQNGRYGPYLTWGKETRSLEDESQIFSVDLDRALALFAQPKARGRRAAAKPLADLGDDPVTKRHVVVRSGRFGLYVTDGETNATLRIGDTPETMTLDRASELLAERRNAEPSTRVRKATKKATKSARPRPRSGRARPRSQPSQINEEDDWGEEGHQGHRLDEARCCRQGRGRQRRVASPLAARTRVERARRLSRL